MCLHSLTLILCACVEKRVHAEHAAARLERHLRPGFHQHSSRPRRERHHAPAQSETAPRRAGQSAEKRRQPPQHHR